jgi:nucleoid DNA-binding protein
MNIVLKQLINDIHHKYGIPKKVIEKVVNNQFLCVKEAMAEGEKNDVDSFRNINLTHLGKFAVREYDKLVRKNVITLKTVDTAAISSVVQTIRKTGEIYKDRCVIYLKEEGHVLAKHKYEDIKRLIKPNILGYGGEESS